MPQDRAQPEAGGRRAIRFENQAFSGLQAIREPLAAGPGPDPDALRNAYLTLLKLCLCDLGGTSTVSVWKDPGGVVMARDLIGDDLQIRALGLDWPLEGLTMVGLHRLDDLQACVESLVCDRVEGDLIEAGAWRGGASILMRATLDALGEEQRRVWVADSFAGFPEPDEAHADTKELVDVDYVAVPLKEVQANFARFGCDRGVEFVPGFFHETMPGLRGRRWSLLRLDGDSYEATWLTLQSLYPGLSVGGYLIIDDYGAVEECSRAVQEFRKRHGISEPIEQVDWTCARWRRTDPTPVEEVEVPGVPAARNGRGPEQGPPRPRPVHVPHVEEIALRQRVADLERELAELRGGLAEAEAAAGSLRTLADWLRHRLGRGSRRA
jgi:O-methyltransferase